VKRHFEKKQTIRSGGKAILRAGLMIAVLAALCAPACEALAKDKTLVVQTWGGSYRQAMVEAFFKPFTKATGIKIIPTSATGSTMTQIKTQVKSNNLEWDIASGLSNDSIDRLVSETLIEPIDYAVVDKTGLLEDSFDPHGVPIYAISTNLVYNASKFKGEKPKNWADFWNVEKFPGPRTMSGIPFVSINCNLAFALIASGVPIDQIYPYDIDRAFKKMDEIKPHIRAWWTSGAHSQQLFTDGEVWMGPMWNGRAMQLKAKGLPIHISQEQGPINYDYWVVLKNTPNKKEAMDFLQFAAQPEQQAEFTKRTFYGPINKKAMDYLPKDLIPEINTYPPNKKKHYRPNTKWLSQHMDKLVERWQKWVTE